jgi:hypothetical protein
MPTGKQNLFSSTMSVKRDLVLMTPGLPDAFFKNTQALTARNGIHEYAHVT